jgi:hypothetical protein
MITLCFSPSGARWLPFSRSFIFSAFLPYKFTPVGDSMLRCALNRDEMNKLSQLSVSVSFTIRIIYLDPFPYMLFKVFIQSIEHVSHVLRLA